MTQGAVAVVAASALIVSRTGSNEGWRAAAASHPPTIATGASTAGTGAQRGRAGVSSGEALTARPYRRVAARPVAPQRVERQRLADRPSRGRADARTGAPEAHHASR
ncbi:hypothetical protein Cma02nite_32120 [Cellulomonas marina]|nr:hypothetical protein Cma02nite_32120 [Cellulomonas marina]